MKLVFSFTIISCLLFWSCEKEIEIDQSKIKPRMVVNCILTPNSNVIQLELSESRDMLYNKPDFPIIKDAAIELFEDGISIGQMAENNEEYELNYTVKTGKIYSIKVNHPDFDAISASTTVPNFINPTVSNINRLQNLSLQFDLNITDVNNENNYYGLEFSRADTLIDTAGQHINMTYDQFGNPIGYDKFVYRSSYLCSVDQFIEYPQASLFDGANCSDIFLLTDELFRNSNHTVPVIDNFNNWANFEAENLATQFTVKMYSYSEDLYKYTLSRELFYLTSGDFFAEPVRLHNNIENGFGVFGAMSRSINLYYVE